MEEQVVIIFAATPQGRDSWVRWYEVKDLGRYEQDLLDYIRTGTDILEEIRDRRSSPTRAGAAS